MKYRSKIFKLSDIFELKKGKPVYMNDVGEGSIPLVTTKTEDNGIAKLIDSDQEINFNAITISNNGLCGTAYYHNYEFIANSDVTILSHQNLNKYNAMYLITRIEQFSFKYSYGSKLGIGKLRDEEIMLPANEDGTVNWEYMTKKMEKIFSYFDKEISIK